MTKYGKEVQLTATDESQFRVVRYMVTDCESPKEADKEILNWIEENPELKKIPGNKKIIDNSLIK